VHLVLADLGQRETKFCSDRPDLILDERVCGWRDSYTSVARMPSGVAATQWKSTRGAASTRPAERPN